MEKQLHFMLRYSDKITSVDTIAEHIKILNQHDSVWMGKFGVGCSQQIIELANNQINNGHVVRIYLVNGCKFTHSADVIEMIGVGGDGGRSPDVSRVPEYYRNTKCKVWFHIKNIEKPIKSEIQSLRLFKSPMSFPQMSGMRGLIYLTDDAFEKEYKNSSKAKNLPSQLDMTEQLSPSELAEIEKERERAKLLTCSLFD